MKSQVETIEAIYCQQTSCWLVEIAALRSCLVEDSDAIAVHSIDSWMKENEAICTVLGDYRSQALVIGNGAVKLGLFISTVRTVSFESAEFGSLVGELQMQIQTLTNILNCILLAKLSHELLGSFLRSHRYASL
ncbi:hypothetical protein EON64_06475 [archaeon]|nr:MAG: hypothetical protein EON64_06475 [archaeon]